MWLVVYIYMCVPMSQTGDNSGGLGQISKFSGNLMGFLYITDNILVHFEESWEWRYTFPKFLQGLEVEKQQSFLNLYFSSYLNFFHILYLDSPKFQIVM